MRIDKKGFFRDATLKICGSLDIEKALWQCLLYIRDFLPASQMSLYIYSQKTGVAEIIAHATEADYRALSIKFMMCEKGRQQVLEQRSIRIHNVPRAGDDPVSAPAMKCLGGLDLPILFMDLVIESEFLGTVAVHGATGIPFGSAHEKLLTMLNEPFAIALSNHLRYRKLQEFNDVLVDRNRYLKNELRMISGVDVIGANFGLKEVMDMARQVAPMDSPVLLMGETGVGKELIASTIHNLSPRREGPLIKVNCGAIPEGLMDSELFGHEKGAFTGAISRKIGRFERANGGTLFLDEVGELSQEAQVRLLRVLQEKEIERVGGTETIRTDIRIIAATHRDLEKMLGSGRFRHDLYYRLKVFPLIIPPLRNRVSDIPSLVQHFIQKKCIEMKMKIIPSLAENALEQLLSYHWPGNVRELENAVERALILCQGAPLTFKEIMVTKTSSNPIRHIPHEMQPNAKELLSLDQAMARHIQKALAVSNGKVEGRGGAAELLQINPRTLRHRMKKIGVPFGRMLKQKNHQPIQS
ncbi:Sigma54 specific transcriptional regulator, Fis family [Desulfosarcina cetonica]|nr:Sigma54 specific transcriptional regulator, Fis family [Desulfosarcina cetonica]